VKKSPALQFVAKAISILLHPVFVPTLIFSFLLLHSPDVFYGVTEKNKHWWLITIAYTTITFPILTVFLLWRLKFIESFEMHHLKERYGPLIASMLFYFWIFWLFHKQFEAPQEIQIMLLGVFLTTVLIFLASIFSKISMHTAAWGGVIALATICVFLQVSHSVLFLSLSLLLGGFVGSARLYLQAHTNKQLYAGYLVGVVGQLIAFLIVKLLNSYVTA
jgi:hypothetical protein